MSQRRFRTLGCRTLGILILGGLIAPSVELHPQVDQPSQAASQPADSSRILASVRSEQANFERFRRRYFPLVRGGGGGRCDERIGRFCLTHDDGDDWAPPPEQSQVTAARTDLISALEGAVAAIPGDHWINGQLVRYLADAGRHQEAVAAAATCRAEPSWCHALSGFAHHYAGRALEAQQAFESALTALPPDIRREWSDLSLLLEGPARSEYRRLGEPERATFEARFWALADPLITRPGNELHSEHLARHVWDALQERALSPEGSTWSGDQREVLIRYGWPLGWERVETTLIQPGLPPLISHLASSPLYLLPPSEALVGASVGLGWDVEDPSPRAEYEIPLEDSVARWFFPLSHQLALFRRGQDVLVAGAWELPADSTPADVQVSAALALLPMPEAIGPAHVTRAEVTGRRGALAGLAAGQPLLASLELILSGERRLARARQGIDPPDPPAASPFLSDLLLIDADQPLPDSLPDAIPRARGSTSVMAGEEVGIFWELYGMDRLSATTAAMSLRLLQEAPGVLRQLAERIGIVREVVPIRLRWEEPVTSTSIAPRAITMRVPAVAPGEYLIELTVETGMGAPLIATRTVQVIR